MKRSFIITLALIVAITVPLCTSSSWARGLGVLGLGGGAAAGVSTPAYESELTRFATSPLTHSSYAVSVTSTVTAGKRVVLLLAFADGATSLSSVTDSAGNSWAIDISYLSGSVRMVIASSVISTGLTSSSTININYAGSAYFSEAGALVVLANAPSTGATASNYSGYTNAVSGSGTTTNAPSVEVGLINTYTATYSSSAWTLIGAANLYGGVQNHHYVYVESAAAGAKNPGGTMSIYDEMSVIWASYY